MPITMDNAQPTDGSPDATNSTAQEDGQTKTKDAVQQRFDQLTAQMNEYRRQAESAQIAANEAMALAARQLQAAQAPAAPAPQQFTVDIPENMDPTAAQFFKNLTAGFQAQLAAQNENMKQMLAQSQGQTAAQTAAIQLQMQLASEPAQVQELAQRLMADWQRSGKSGWAPADAVSFARYNLGLPNTRVGRGPAAPNGNAEDHTVMAPGASVPAPTRTAIAAPLPDAVIAKMSPVQQEAYYAKRIAAQSSGHVDVPVIFDS